MSGPAGRVTKLTDIETLGVALVQRGANRKKFGVKKSDDDEGDGMSLTVAQKIAEVITKGELPVDDAAFDAKIKEAGLTDPQAIETAKALVKLASAFKDNGAFQKFVSEVLPSILGIGGGDAPPAEGDAPPADAKAPPGKDAPADTPSGGNKPPPEGDKNVDYAGQKTDPEKEKPPMSTQKDDKTAGNGNGATTDVAKADEKIAQLEALVKSQQDSFKETLARLEKSAKDASDAALLKDWCAVAKAELQFVPGKSAAELGKMLFDLETKISKESADAQFSVLKASSLALQKSALFTPAGAQPKGNVATEGGSDAMSRIAKSAATVLEKSDILKTELPGMEGLNSRTKAEIQKAMSVQKALELEPELYADYLREHREQSGNRYGA